MKKQSIQWIVLSMAALAIVFTACRKEREIDNDTSTASDNQLFTSMFNEVSNMADAVVSNTYAQTPYRSMTDTFGCAIVTWDTAVFPHTITIDFGPTNCTCADGRKRRGTVNISYTGPYRSTGTVITHTFTNYFVNDNQITGTKTVTNMGQNGSGQSYFNISENGTIYKANGGTITWQSNRVRTWIAGESTVANWLDDVYLITGSGNGTNSAGTSYTVNITQALRVELSCPRIVSGTVDITPSGKSVRTLDYGSGACDAVATVTINGNTYTIVLF